MQQEDAMFGLTAALRAVGEYTTDTMNKLREFANIMQELTIYQDNEILALQKTLTILGVHSNQLRQATQMTIGLSDALGVGTQSAARYVALGLQGQTTMLRRYIPALKEAKSETESLQILTDFCSRSFEISTAKAQTTSGAIKQMRNAFSEAGEAIGFAILPTLKSLAISVKEWVMSHKEAIASWAQTTMTYVLFAKDVFIDFINYMRSDWKGGTELAFRVILEVTKGFIDAFVLLVKEGAHRGAEAFVQAFGISIAKGLLRISQSTKYITPLPALAEALGARKILGAVAAPPEMRPPITPQLEAIAKQTFENIKDLTKDSGTDISKSTENLNKRLIDLKKVQQDEITTIEVKGTEKLINLAQEKINMQITLNERLADEIKKTSIKSLEDQAKALELVISGQARTIQSAQELIKIQEQLGEGTKATADMWDLYREKENKVLSLERWVKLGESIESSIGGAFEKLIFEGQKFGAAMTDMARAITQEFIRIQFIQPAAQWLSGITTSFLPKVTPAVAHSGGSVGSLPSYGRSIPSSIFNQASKYGWLKPGEEAIIAHRGETISREGSQSNPPVVVNISQQNIDTKSGVQFLAQHERFLAGLIKNAIGKNNSLRRRI